MSIFRRNKKVGVGEADMKESVAHKQDKLVDDGVTSSIATSDYTTGIKNVNGQLHYKSFTFLSVWNWIVSKLTDNVEKGLQVASGKLGHSNSITAPTAGRIICGNYDEQGHVSSIAKEFNYSDVYNSSLDDCLFTRKGANNLYNWAKITDATGSNAVTTTGLDSALSRTNASHQSTISRVMKYCGVVSLQYFGQYSASAAISGKFTCIGSVPADYVPVSRAAIQVTNWNCTPAGSACGYVDRDGKIYVWVSAITSGATNIQFCINATWKGA